MHFQDQKTKMITQAALIAAVYVALVLIFKPISFGTRISSWYVFRPSWSMPLSCPLFYSMLTGYRTAIPSYLLQWDWERLLR